MADFYGDGYTGGYVLPDELARPATHRDATTPNLRVEIDPIHDANPAVGPLLPLTWVDVSPWLQDPGMVMGPRGRTQTLNRNEAATATFTFENVDRTFDPGNDESVLSPGLSTMRHIRATSVFEDNSTPFVVGSSYVGGTDLVGGGDSEDVIGLFYGLIESIKFSYPGKGKYAIATVQATDMFGAFAKEPVPASYVASLALTSERASDRLNRLLNTLVFTGSVPGVTWIDPMTGQLRVDSDPAPDYRDIPEGKGRFMAFTDYAGSGMLEALQDVEVSDGGNFFISRDGFITYRDSSWPLRPVEHELVFSALPADERYADIVFEMDETLVYNVVTVEASAGNLTGSDAPSQAHYFDRPYTLSTVLDGAEMPGRLSEFLTKFRKEAKAIHQLDLSNVVKNWKQILSCELWDKVMIQVPLPNGDIIEQESLIEGIAISTPNHRDWRISWWLSVAPFPELLSAGDADFESGVGAWTVETNCSLSAYNGYLSTPNGWVPYIQPLSGMGAMRIEPIANGDLSFVSSLITIEGRRTYLVSVPTSAMGSAFFGSDTAAWAEIVWLDAVSMVISTAIGETKVTSSSRYSLLQVEARAPSGAFFAQIRVRVIDALMSTGTNFYQLHGYLVDDVSFARSE